MRVTISRTAGRTPWGIYGNVWPTALSRLDRATLGVWYVAIHTPWRVLDITGRVEP